MPSQEELALRDGARLKKNIALGGYITAGVTATVGFVLLYFNRPKPYRADVEGLDEDEYDYEENVAVLPLLGPSVIGLSAAFRF